MAAPTAVDRDQIADDALERAGFSADAASTVYDLLEEVKSDIVGLVPEFAKSLEATSISVTVVNRDLYLFPSDMILLTSTMGVKMNVLDGEHRGTFQAGSSISSLKLEAAEDATQAEVEGKRILVTSGSAIRGIGTCTSYIEGTQTAAVTPSLNNGAPASGDDYLIVNNNFPLEIFPLSQAQTVKQGTAPARSTHAFWGQSPNDATKLFRLKPVPDALYGLELVYPVDLTQVDLSSTLLATVYARWRSLFVQGVVAKKLQLEGDSRYVEERKMYTTMLLALTGKENRSGV